MNHHICGHCSEARSKCVAWDILEGLPEKVPLALRAEGSLARTGGECSQARLRDCKNMARGEPEEEIVRPAGWQGSTARWGCRGGRAELLCWKVTLRSLDPSFSPEVRGLVCVVHSSIQDAWQKGWRIVGAQEPGRSE